MGQFQMIHQEMKFLALRLGCSALETFGIKKTKNTRAQRAVNPAFYKQSSSTDVNHWLLLPQEAVMHNKHLIASPAF